MGYSTSQKGFQSLEVIISLTLFALLFAAIFTLFGSSITESHGLLKQARVNTLINEALDATYVLSQTDWEQLTEGQHGLVFVTDHWEFSGETDITDETFTRTVTLSDVSTDEKDVAIEVSWDFLGRSLSRSVNTRFTNWKHVEVWGDWGVPIVVGSLDIGPQGEATGVARSGDYVFLTASTSSGTRPTLYSIDISDPYNPVIVDSYTTTDSLVSLAVVMETYLYAVGDSDELLVFDVSDPLNIQFISSISTGNKGLRVISDETEVYVGTQQDIRIYDITTPSTPSLLSQYAVGAEVNGLSLGGEYLYAATSDDTQELLILSIADLENPSYAGEYDITGTQDAVGVHADGQVLYLGTRNNPSVKPEFYQFDRTDPVSVVLKNEVDVGGGVREITTAGPYVYLATEASNLEFQIWQTGSSWSLNYEAGINMAQVATGITFDDNTIFISLRSNDAFQIIQPSP
jgi:hypothetical protein